MAEEDPKEIMIEGRKEGPGDLPIPSGRLEDYQLIKTTKMWKKPCNPIFKID